jgi:uncharacterized protein YegL
MKLTTLRFVEVLGWLLMSIISEIEVGYQKEPHVAVVLLLETSSSITFAGSMNVPNITQLNYSLKIFKKELEEDPLARKRVDLAVITFGGSVKVIHDFSSIENFDPPNILSASGDTPMGEAILKAVYFVEERLQTYREKGIQFYIPWIFMITDGEPNMRPGSSMWNEVINKVHNGQKNKKFLFFTVGVMSANMKLLTQIAPPEIEPIILMKGMFKEMFRWLSLSLSRVAKSTPGDQIALNDPTSPEGWATIYKG